MEKIAAKPRNVFVVAFPGCQVLDVTGPMEALGKAQIPLNTAQGSKQVPAYPLTLLAEQSGPVKSSGPVCLCADKSYLEIGASELEDLDTLIISGGDGTHAAVRDNRLIDFVLRASQQARRTVSICTGAFILAQAGLLNNRRATTHWESVDLLAKTYPGINVDGDAIYVRDGKYWTSAGVTAGIDLSLALIEEDLGRNTALTIARRLVVYMMRPGGQAQFSAQLKFQQPAQGRLTTLFEWVEQNPAEDLSIPALAAKCAMSERHFARCFVEETGVTPAKFVEHSRLDHARRLLETSHCSLDQIARDCGFRSAEILRRSFDRQLHLTPSDYRKRFFTSLRPAQSGNPNKEDFK